MSPPCGSSELADGLKEGLEEGREFQEFYSWSHMEGCLVLGKTALDSMQMASQDGLHWSTEDLLGVMRATD